MTRTNPERKPREEAEAYLVSSYIAARYPDDRVFMRVRLGAIESELPPGGLTPSEMAMVGSFRRWADAIVIRDNELILIEGAIRPALGDVSIIQAYARLMEVTPELRPYRSLPVRLELVAAIEDPIVSQLCREAGIKFVLFSTASTDDYISRILPRFGRPPRAGGFQ